MKIYFISLTVALLAAASDVKSRKITNRFIIRGYLIGLIYQIIQFIFKGDFTYVKDAFIGFLLPYFFIILYSLNVIGAADIKLFSVIGMIIGTKRVLLLIVLSPDKNSDYIYKYQSAKVIKSYIFDDLKKVRKSLITHKEKEKDIKLRVKEKVQNKLLINGEGSDNETLKTIDEFIESEDGVLSTSEKNDIRNKVFYSIRGLDVLEELISDESITEIMVNSENMIFYEKNGKLLNSYKCFDSKKQLLDIIRKIVSDANRTVNVSSPIVDARLKNGSRVNVVLEPVSINGPTLTIRRFPKNPITKCRRKAPCFSNGDIRQLFSLD